MQYIKQHIMHKLGLFSVVSSQLVIEYCYLINFVQIKLEHGLLKYEHVVYQLFTRKRLTFMIILSLE